MSGKTIDERVVQMQFDNKQFESGVNTTMSSLEKLKKALKFDGASKGLDNINSAAKKCDMSGLSGAVEKVRLKFSALDAAAIAVMTNIANSALETGKKVISALTIDPAISGFQEYETQINAVQTILANTSSKGTTIDQVNAALDELNHYADKTIYNFTEMTRNIGTFTAAGVDLDTSVSAIQGIANLAAVSGSNSQQASTAMYQLSQALAAGTVKLMDWNSVVNAGMGGEVFQNALKETARLHGVAVDQIIADQGSFRESLQEGWITSDILIETLSKFTTTGANEYLAEFTGLSADSIAKMREQAVSSGDVNEAYREMAKTLSANSKLTEDQIYELLSMSTTAEDAATKVKTFTQLTDTLKEALQSGWTQTWETLIGDFEESKELFTEISDTFGDMINKSSDTRNAMLEEAMSPQWEKLEKKVTDCGVATEDFQNALKEVARSHGIDIDTMIKEEGSFQDTLKNGWLTTDVFSEAIGKLTTKVSSSSETTSKFGEVMEKTSSITSDLGNVVNRVLQGEFGNGEERVKALTAAGYDYATVQKFVNDVIAGGSINIASLSDSQLENLGYTKEQISSLRELAAQAEKAGVSISDLNITDLSDAQLENLGYTEEQIKALRELAEQAKITGSDMNELIENVSKPSGRELFVDTIRNAMQGFIKILETVKSAWHDVFSGMDSGQLYGIIETIHDLSEKLLLSDESAAKLKSTLRGLFSVLDIIGTIVSGVLQAGLKVLSGLFKNTDKSVLDLTASIGDNIYNFRNWMKENDVVTKTITNLANAVTTVIGKIRDWIKAFMELPQVQKVITSVKNAVSDIFGDLKEYFRGGIEQFSSFIDRLKEVDSFSLDNLKTVFKDFVDNVIGYFLNFDGAFENIKKGISSFKDSAKTHLDAVGKIFDNLKQKISDFVNFVKEFLGDHLGSIISIGLSAALLFVVKKVTDAIESIGGFLSGIQDVISSIGQALENLIGSVTKVLKAHALKTQSQALLNIAKSVVILAGAAALLTQLDQDALLNSGKVLGELAVGLGLFAAALGGMQKLGLDASKASLSMLGMASTLLLVSEALKQMEQLKPKRMVKDLDVMKQIAIGFVSVQAAMKALDKVFKSDSGSSSANALAIVAMAASMRILVGAFKDLDSMNVEHLGTSILALISIAGSLSLLMKACKEIKGSSFAVLLSAAVSLKVIISALDDLTGMDLGGMASGIAAIGIVFTEFAGLIAATRLAGKDAPNTDKVGAMILKMSASLLVLAQAFKMLGNMDTGVLGQGLTAVTMMMGVFTIVMGFSKLAGENAAKAGTMILEMSAAVVVLAGAMAVLSLLDPAGLKQALEAVSILGVIFGGLIAMSSMAGECKSTVLAISAAIAVLSVALGALSFIEPSKLLPASAALSLVMAMFALIVSATANVKKANSTLIILSAAVAVLGAVIYALSGLPWQGSLAAAASLSIVMASFAASLLIISNAQPIARSANVTLGVMTLVTAALAVIIGALAAFDVGPTLEIAASLSVLLLSLSAACKILSTAGPISKGALVGIAEMTAVITAIGALLTLIGELMTEQFPQGEEFLNKGISMLEKIGEGLGNFAGNIVGGFLDKASEGLEDVGRHLSNFMTNAMPFFMGMSAMDAGVIDGIGTLAKVIITLTASDILTGITRLMGTEGASLEGFGDRIKDLGEGIAAFTTSTANVDASKVETAANAAKILADLEANLPSHGGTIQKFFGDQNLGQFSKKLEPLGTALAAYAKAIDNIDEGKVKSSANAAKVLAELESNLPAQGGKLQKYFGEQTLSQFGEKLQTFGEGLAAYATVVEDVKPHKVKASANAAKVLAELENNLPSQGGKLQKYFGEQTLSQFGEKLKTFGQGLADYATVVEDIKPHKVKASANAAQLLAELENNLPAQGGKLQIIFGEQTLSQFGEKLETFGQGLAAYSVAVKDVKPKNVRNSAEAAKALAELESSLDNEGGFFSLFTGDNTLDNFGNNLTALGTGLSDLSASVDESGLTKIHTIIDTTKQIIDIGAQLGETDYSSTLMNFSSSIFGFGQSVSSFYDSISYIDTSLLSSVISSISRLINMADSMASVDSSAMGSFGENLAKLAQSGIDKAVETFENGSEKLRVAINNMINAAVIAVKSGELTSSLKTAFEQLIKTGLGVLTNLAYLASYKTAGTNLVTQFLNGVDQARSQKLNSTFQQIITDALSVLDSPDSRCRFLDTARTLVIDFLDMVDQTGAKKTKTTFKNIIDDAFNLLDGGDSKNKFKKAATDLVEQFLTTVNQIRTQKVKSTFLKIINDAISVLDGGEAKSKFKKSATDLMNQFLNTVNSIRSQKAKSTFSKIITDAIRALSKESSFKNAGKTDTNEFFNGVSTSYSNNRHIFTDIYNQSANTLRDGGYLPFYDAGVLLVRGFINGIRSQINSAASAAASMAATASAAARASLKVRSPSKVFYQIGAYTGEGFINGISSFTDKVKMTAGNMGSAATNAISNAVSGLSDSVSDIDADPTIRPIMDLSEIQNGANRINNLMNDMNGYEVSGSFNLANGVINDSNQRNLSEDISAKKIDDLCRAVQILADRDNQPVTNNFNITGNDPRAIADEVSRRLQMQYERRRIALG